MQDPTGFLGLQTFPRACSPAYPVSRNEPALVLFYIIAAQDTVFWIQTSGDRNLYGLMYTLIRKNLWKTGIYVRISQEKQSIQNIRGELSSCANIQLHS
jgi:hypothetical protein